MKHKYPIDLTGLRFGRVVAIKRVKEEFYPCGKHATLWLCKCDCGTEFMALRGNLVSGHTGSCGCLRNEKISQGAKTHGKSDTKTYKAWVHIKDRCYRVTDKEFKDYGGRGITVCDRWKNSFENFYDDVSKLPYFGERGRSLDRIDNEGNYEPNNVRWATREEQANNKRSNKSITYDGKVQTLKRWSDELNLPYKLLWSRLYKLHWSIEQAFTTPVQTKCRPKRLRGAKSCHTV